MNIPPDPKPWIQGAVVGFSWGGWVTGSSANEQASVAAHDAIGKTQASICVESLTNQTIPKI